MGDFVIDCRSSCGAVLPSWLFRITERLRYCQRPRRSAGGNFQVAEYEWEEADGTPAVTCNMQIVFGRR